MIQPEEITYVSQDGVRWASRQIQIHKIKTGLNRLLLINMAMHADADGLLWPTQCRLAELTGGNLRSIERSIRNYLATEPPLMKTVRLSAERRMGPGRHTAYQLLDWKELAAVRMDVHPPYATRSPNVYPTPPVLQPKIVDSGVGYSDVYPTQPTRLPDSERRSPDSRGTVHPTRESGKDSIEDSIEDSREDSIEDSRYPQAALCAATSSPAAPPPPHPPVVGRKGPVGLLKPGDLVMAYDDAVDGSPLVSLNRSPNKAECIMLTQAIKHPALDGNIEAWKRYCRWATKDTWLRGDRDGGYPGMLHQLCRDRTIDRWARTAKPVKRQVQSDWSALTDPDWVPPKMTPIGKNGEHHDPNRRWNEKTETWDYIYPPGFREAVAEFTISGPGDPKLKILEAETLAEAARRGCLEEGGG